MLEQQRRPWRLEEAERDGEVGLTRPNLSWRDVTQRGRQDTSVGTDKTEAAETSKAGKDKTEAAEK